MAQIALVREPTKAAPRYKLKPKDNHILRFVRSIRNQQQSFQSELFDISNNGIAFIVQERLSPKIGEVIAIEFRAPGGRLLAIYGRVARTAKYSKEDSMLAWSVVGVAFEKWTETHQNFLQRTLEKNAIRKPNFFVKPTYATKYKVKRKNETWEMVKGFAIIMAVVVLMTYIYSSQNLKRTQLINPNWADNFSKQIMKK